MLKSFTKRLLLGSGCLLAVSSCRHHDDPPNPCQGMTLKPLTFQFLEYPGTPTPDTTYNNQVVTFAGPGAPYTAWDWQVGSALNTRNVQQFALRFDDVTTGPISVRLIARRPPNTACFPHDDGVDTLTKVLTLVPFKDSRAPIRDPHAPIYGKFQGATTDAPRDTFTVRIYQGINFDYPTDPTAPPSDYISNLPKGCSRSNYLNYLSWRSIFIDTNFCTSDQGTGYLTSRDSIRISYFVQGNTARLTKVFLGKRIR